MIGIRGEEADFVEQANKNISTPALALAFLLVQICD